MDNNFTHGVQLPIFGKPLLAILKFVLDIAVLNLITSQKFWFLIKCYWLWKTGIEKIYGCCAKKNSVCNLYVMASKIFTFDSCSNFHTHFLLIIITCSLHNRCTIFFMIKKLKSNNANNEANFFKKIYFIMLALK